MKLYDDVIKEFLTMLNGHEAVSFPVDRDEKWPDTGKRNLVLPFDMAYELGGSVKQQVAAGGTAITTDKSLVDQDEILLYGKDLTQIEKETSYCRFTVCLVDDSEIGEGNELFNTVKAIDFVRYHVNPDGFMMRVSASAKRESVRVSKDAVAKGISFKDAGNLMLNSYRKNPKVKAAKIIFIDDESMDFEALEKAVRKCELITKTIDHIGKNAVMECDTCGLQKVCEEVEGMRELHFKNSGAAVKS